jgi:phage terminase large subunit
MTEIFETGYVPREPQREIHKAVRDNRFVVAVCHRRMGKTVAAINQLIHSALKCDKKDPRYAYIAPTYSQAKRIAFDYLVEYTRPLNAVVNIAELRIDFMGRRISLYGADSPDSLRGIYLDGVVVDEVGDVSPALFTDVIRPALSDRLGWCTFIGTPKGANHFKELRDRADTAKKGEGWKLLEFKASETGIINEQELIDAKKSMGDNKYNQEFEISFDAPIVGSFYGELLADITKDNHVTNIAEDSLCRGITAWDLGMGDSTSIWVAQIHGMEIRLVNYYENHGQGLDHYVQWIKDNGYKDYEHILPHDVVVRELGTGKSRKEVLEEAGLDISVAPKLSIEDGIQAVRRMIPNCWFNKDTTKYGLECLRNYRRQFNDKLNVYMTAPLHDWSSHCADALRYLAVGMTSNTYRSNWDKPLDNNNNWIV